MEAPHHVKLVVDVAVLREGRVLLTRYRRAEHLDGQRGLFLPNGLLLEREDPEDAAARVLREQLGINMVALRLAFAESFTGQDRTWHLALHYAVDLSPDVAPEPSDELAETQWFGLDELPARRDVAHGGWALQTIARVLDAQSRAVA